MSEKFTCASFGSSARPKTINYRYRILAKIHDIRSDKQIQFVNDVDQRRMA